MGDKLIVGNWKMNGALGANKALIGDIIAGLEKMHGSALVKVAVAPPAVYLPQVADLLQDRAAPALAAQDVSVAADGAYTGDVSAGMLAEFGVRYVLVGHSERRKYQHESNETVADKAAAAQAAGLTPIVCLGETLPERDAGRALEVVREQLQAVLDHSGVQAQRLVLAYEPVWAIGTGRTATPAQAQQVHAALRRQLAAGSGESRQLLLYGGSMNAGNAAELLAQPDINGGLIGGAALKAADFIAIVRAAAQAAGAAG